MSTTFVGRLVRDPKSFDVNGRQKALFTIAVDRPYTDNKGDRPADFPPIAAWNGLGQTVMNHLCKGRLVAVECHYRSYVTENNGKKEYGHEFVADNIRFLDAPPQNNNNQGQQQGNQGQQQPAPQGYQQNPNYQYQNQQNTAPNYQQQPNQAQYQNGQGNYNGNGANVPF